MASNLAGIYLDYHDTKRKAKQLEDAAEDLRRIAENSMVDYFENIRNVWTGDNANAFMNKGEQARTQIKKTAEQMYKISRAIEDIAQQIYEADMKNYKLIHGMKC